MRVTSHIQYLHATRSVGEASSRLAQTQVQAATGRRIDRPSDDPSGTGEALSTRSQLRATSQSFRNIEAARRRLDAEDDILGSVNDLLGRAKELGLSQIGSTASPQTRLIVKKEVDELLDTVIGLGNTQSAGAFLFGGNYADQRPFDAAGAVSPTAPPVGELEIDIGSGVRILTNHDGQTAFIDSGVMGALQNLSAALAANDDTMIANAVTDVDNAIDGTQELIADVGSRWVRLDHTEAALENAELNMEQRRSELEDADLASVLVELSTRQTALQAALAATARASELTLTNYL